MKKKTKLSCFFFNSIIKLKERKLYHYDSIFILSYTSNPISIVIVDNILSIVCNSVLLLVI